MHPLRSLATYVLQFALCVLLLMPVDDLRAQDSDNPPVPAIAGADSGDGNAIESEQPAIRVALVDSGVNYLLPQINERLARDSDGQLIGYDFWDMDDRPFDSHPDGRGNVQRHGTRTASILLREAPFAALVPYRYPRPDMTRMRELIAHAARNQVRVIGLPLGGNRRDQWTVFEAAALEYPDILFVASAGNNGRDIDEQPVYPAALPLPNMLVVTSADDFIAPAQGVNWGRTSVDYIVPAERQPITRFDGEESHASGSSYAVPRVVALAARLLHDKPSMTASELIAEIRRRFANGAAPRQIGQGYLHDPQLDDDASIAITGQRQWVYQTPELPAARAEVAIAAGVTPLVKVPLDVFVLDERWQTNVDAVLQEAQSILAVCGIHLDPVDVNTVQAPDYLKDLETGAAKTLMFSLRSALRTVMQSALHSHSQESSAVVTRRAAVLFARETRMNIAFDAEAFGKGNTRSRSWMTNSVWLTLALQDRGIALAHELFHVLANSGEHSNEAGNLMLGRTTGSNKTLTPQQCESVRSRAVEAELAYQISR